MFPARMAAGGDPLERPVGSRDRRSRAHGKAERALQRRARVRVVRVAEPLPTRREARDEGLRDEG